MSNIDTELQEFAHFERTDGGRFLLWAVDECEDCGGECQAVNTPIDVGISGDALGAFKRNNVTERPLSDCLGELGYSENFGGAVCDGCYGKNEEEVA
jgi:hypothetical protein